MSLRATLLLGLASLLWVEPGHAQPPPMPDEPAPSEPAPRPTPTPAPQPTPRQQPEPQLQPTPQPQPQPTPAPQPAPQPAPAPQPQPAPQPAPAPQPQPTPQPAPAPQPQAPARTSAEAGPPAPPPKRYEGQVDPGEPYAAPEEGGGDGSNFEMPPLSIRLDPLNWLLEGKLGFELEVGVWKLISAELVPVFVVNESPPVHNLFGSLEDELSQHGDAIGALAGASLGVGFWLDGEPFSGTVLRAILTNYSFRYDARDPDGTLFDRVEHTQRRFGGFIGSSSRWGFFTIGGGLALLYELNQKDRCDLVRTSDSGLFGGVSRGCDGELLIATRRGTGRATQVADLNGLLHPFYLEGRLSLGLVFD